MAQRSRTVPLFDLVPRRAPAGSDRPVVTGAMPTLPTESLEAKPLVTDIAATPKRPRQGLPGAMLGMAVFAILLIALGAYVLGTRVGAAQKEKELGSVLRSNPPAVREPANGGMLENLTLSDKPALPNPDARRSANSQPSTPTSTLPGGIVLPSVSPEAFDNPPPSQEVMIASNASQGWLESDPRPSGRNYLTLGVFSRREAGTAVLLLHANGVEAVAIPVDKPGGGANNRGPLFYRVWALQGLTSEQFRAGDPLKGRVEQRVREIGRAWKQAKGPSDFADAFWDKLN